jgi:RNA polymerase sigma-70 factor (ECF subfamily)
MEKGEQVSIAPRQAGCSLYEELYHAHYPSVVLCCRWLLADPHEAEEVAQDVFLRLFRQCQAPHLPVAWQPWLTRVTINVCRDRRRSGWWQGP